MSTPNIIFITTDQQRTDSVGCYGSPWMATPNFDRMARGGVRFDRAYCTNAVCTPSRASILSGRHLSRHGAWNVGLSVPDDEVFLSHRLRPLGYRTHLVGKAHFQAFGGTAEESIESIRAWRPRYPGFTGPYYGFETVELALGHTIWGLAGHYGCWVEEKAGRRTDPLFASHRRSAVEFGGEAYDWDLPVELANSLWTGARAAAFLEEAAADGRPFFLSVGFEDPHHPHAVPVEIARQLDHGRAPLPRYAEGELADKPPHFIAAREGRLEASPVRGQFPVAGQHTGFDFRPVGAEDARLGRSYYYALVELIDRGMGMILDALERTGLDRTTLVVFTTDHGELLGDHGLWMKGPFHYEQLVRVPLIVQLPGHEQAGRTVTSIASLVDLAPTALALLDLAVPGDLDGTSLLPVLRGGAAARDACAFVETVDDPRGLRLKTVVGDRYKLTCYHGHRFGELYDLHDDPGEIRNRWSDPSYAEVKADLLARLVDAGERLEKRASRYCYA